MKSCAAAANDRTRKKIESTLMNHRFGRLCLEQVNKRMLVLNSRRPSLCSAHRREVLWI